MPFGEQRTNLILIVGALLLALIVGIAIPLASGSQPGRKTTPWTPPAAIETATRTAPSRTVPPLATLPPATPTAVPVKPTQTAAPTPSSLPPTATAAVAPTQTATRPAATATGAPLPSPAGARSATVRQGPLIARTGPSKDLPVFALVQVSDTFSVTGRTANSAWLQVCCVKNTPVWLAAEFLEVTGSVESLPILP